MCRTGLPGLGYPRIGAVNLTLLESDCMAEVTQPLRFALAQLNTTVGDIEGNAVAIVETLGRARSEGAQVVVFPELAVTGYPPEDLLLKTHFLSASRRAVDEIAREVGEMVALVGFAEHAEDV